MCTLSSPTRARCRRSYPQIICTASDGTCVRRVPSNNLGEQRAAVGVPEVQPVVQVGLELIQHAGPPIACGGQQVLHRGGAGEAAHRFLGQAQLTHDGFDPLALLAQGLHGRIPLPGAGDQGGGLPASERGLFGELPEVRCGIRLGRWAGGRLGPATAVSGHRFLRVFGEVVPQMPAVGHLHRLRGAGGRALAYAPARSRHTTRTPGCARSQAASVSASRSGSRSTGWWVSMGRFMLQDTIGNVYRPMRDVSWKPGVWATSAAVVAAWGYFLYTGVTNPLGGINQLFPLFGIANPLLAAIALTVCTTLLIKTGKVKWAWVTGIPLAWDATVTLTASWQKVFSDSPTLGFFAQRARYQEALDAGKVLAPAKSLQAMQTVVTNSIVDGVLAAFFALLVVIVIADAVRDGFKLYAPRCRCRPRRRPTPSR